MVACTSLVSAVVNFIRYVVGWRLPKEVAFGNASRVPIAARMSSMVPIGWRRPVNVFANETRNISNFPTSIKLGVSSAGFGVRPYQAFISLVFENHITIKRQWFPFGGRPTSRTSVPKLPQIVGLAKTFSFHRLAAFWNKAYTSFSHSDLLARLAWLERVVGLPPFGAFVICIIQNVRLQRKSEADIAYL